MSENKFREHEVVRIRGKEYPLLAGRLRLALEGTDKIVVRSELLRFEPGTLAVTRVTVETAKGTTTAHGVAGADRDPDFVGALAELSESRAVCRALRWLGHGLEVGYEELGDGHLADREPARHELRPVAGRVNDGAGGGNGVRGTPCTSAQRRALQSLARQLGQDLDDVVAKVCPGTDAEHLTLAQASGLIDRMKAKAGNGAGAGR